MAAEAEILVNKVIRAYGGAARWSAARAATGAVRLGGRLFQTKRVSVPVPMQITTQLEQPYARLDPIDGRGHLGVLEGPHVRLEGRGGEVVAQRENARDRLLAGAGGHWDTQDLTYFLGYAFWGYNALVRWLLRDDVQRRILAPGVLELTLPRGTPAHSLTQQFYFDAASALLTRNDYHPDVAVSDPRIWAANLVRRHGSSNGVPYPSRRRVKPRPGRRPLPVPTFVSIDVSDWRLLE
jgi:hypothetical protein